MAVLKSFAQQNATVDLQKLIPRKFINKVGIIVGPTYLMPYENTGYAQAFINQPNPLPNFTFDYRIENKWGLNAGIVAIHAINRRFEIESRLQYEKMGYIEIEEIIQPSDDRMHRIDINANFITLSMVTNFTIERNFSVSLGFKYNKILNSDGVSETYVNGVGMTRDFPKFDNDYYNQFNGNILAGAGYLIEINSQIQFKTQLQLGYGIGNLKKVSNSYIIKSNALTLNIYFILKR
jgi:hypothetical protein